jgi:hypothetical protein
MVLLGVLFLWLLLVPTASIIISVITAVVARIFTQFIINATIILTHVHLVLVGIDVVGS